MVCSANHYYWTLRPIKVNLCSSFICAALIREHKTFKWCSGLTDKNTFRTLLIFFCAWAKGMYLIRYARKDSDCVFCAMITHEKEWDIETAHQCKVEDVLHCRQVPEQEKVRKCNLVNNLVRNGDEMISIQC